MSLYCSNPPGRWTGIFTIPYQSVDTVTRLNCLHFGGFFCRQLLRHFHHLHLADFYVVFSLWVFTSSLILNAFRIRQDTTFWTPNFWPPSPHLLTPLDPWTLPPWTPVVCSKMYWRNLFSFIKTMKDTWSFNNYFLTSIFELGSAVCITPRRKNFSLSK